MASGQLPVFITLPSSGAGQGRAGLPGSCAPEASPSSEDRRSCVGTGTECPWELCFSSGMRSPKGRGSLSPKGAWRKPGGGGEYGGDGAGPPGKGPEPPPPKKKKPGPARSFFVLCRENRLPSSPPPPRPRPDCSQLDSFPLCSLRLPKPHSDAIPPCLRPAVAPRCLQAGGGVGVHQVPEPHSCELSSSLAHIQPVGKSWGLSDPPCWRMAMGPRDPSRSVHCQHSSQRGRFHKQTRSSRVRA